MTGQKYYYTKYEITILYLPFRKKVEIYQLLKDYDSLYLVVFRKIDKNK